MKTRLLLCLVTALALIAAACGSDDTTDVESADADTETPASASASEPEPTEAPAEAASTPTEAPATEATEGAVDDDSQAVDEQTEGEPSQIEFPQRIVSLNPTATEMLFAIGAGDQVIAVDEFSYYPDDAPVTDLSGFQTNYEALAGYEPDLVVTDTPRDELNELDIDNHVVPAATTLDDIYTQIEQLGAVTGNVGGAAELVLQMQTDIDAVLSQVPDREIPLTYYHELDNTLYSVTSTTFVGYVYDLFGLQNIADPADEDGSAFGYPQLSEEFVIAADPDLIFLGDTLCCGQTAATVAERPGWDQIAAVSNGNIVELNDDVVSRWGPRIVDFIEAVGAAVVELEAVPAS